MIWALAYFPMLAGLALWAIGGSRLRLGALAALANLATLTLAFLASGTTGQFDWSRTIALHSALPPVAQAVAVMVPAIALAVVVFAASHEEKQGLPRLLGILMVFVGGMQLIVIAQDLITLLVGWEIVGACSWALIGHKWRETSAGASANFAFVITRAGDLGLFIALFATFAGTGSTSYEALGTLSGGYLWVAASGLLIASASKAGQVPFAPWLFRAMDGPTSVSALLHSATMVAAGVYLLARVQPQLSQAPGFGAAAIAVGLTTAILAGWVALQQTHAKKLLAGSTSAQMGLMIATVGAGYPDVAILHLIVHAATKAALFFAAGVAHSATHSFDLRDMRLGRTLPFAGILTAISALSLAAVPPLSGGWSKEELIKALEHAGPFLSLAGIVAGGLTAAYATRFAVAAFGPGDDRDKKSAMGELAALAWLTLLVLVMSSLWLPSVHDTAARWIGADLPEGTRIGLIASLLAVAFGALIGLRGSRNLHNAPAREWLGLGMAHEHGIIRPFHAFAKFAARIDDQVIDFIPRGAVYLMQNGSITLARSDDNLIDLIPRGAVYLMQNGSITLARSDDNLIDGMTPGAIAGVQNGSVRILSGAVSIVARGTAALAHIMARGGERLSDLIPTGIGRIAAMAASDLRRLQTGLAHHYYTILMAGFALVAGLLIFGA